MLSSYSQVTLLHGTHPFGLFQAKGTGSIQESFFMPELSKSNTSESPFLSAFFGTAIVQRHFDGFLEDSLKSFDLTRADFDTLYFLRFRLSKSAVTLSELSSTFNISPGSASERVNRLLGNKLVSRRVNPHRRNTISVRITPKGIETVDNILLSLTALCDEFLGRVFEPKELDCYLKLNSKLIAFIKETP